MAVIRLKRRDNPYVQIDRTPLEDERLSFKGRGILAYLLCKPDTWRCRLTDLIAKSPDGRDSIQSGLAELRTLGYARLVREQSEAGQLLGTFYDVYENPQDNPEFRSPPLAEEARKNGKKAAKTEDFAPVPRQTENPSDGEAGERENRLTENPQPSTGFSGRRESRQTEKPSDGKPGSLVRTSGSKNHVEQRTNSDSGAAGAAPSESRFKIFGQWVRDHCPHLPKPEKLVSEPQFGLLVDKHGPQALAAFCKEIDALYAWITLNAPRVREMATPIQLNTWVLQGADQKPALRERPRALLEDILLAMQNSAQLLKKNSDAGLTMRNWAALRDQNSASGGAAPAPPTTRVGTNAAALVAAQNAPMTPQSATPTAG